MLLCEGMRGLFLLYVDVGIWEIMVDRAEVVWYNEYKNWEEVK